MERIKQLTAKIEPFDSFWEAPDDIEKGYRSFGLFYKDNYAGYFPADKNAKILCVSCGPGYLVNLLTELGYTNVEGIDSFPDKVAYAEARNLNCSVAFAFDFLAEAEISRGGARLDVPRHQRARWIEDEETFGLTGVPPGEHLVHFGT